MLRKQKMFLPPVKHVFAFRTQILLPKCVLLSLATMEAILTNKKANRKLPKAVFTLSAQALVPGHWQKIKSTHFSI